MTWTKEREDEIREVAGVRSRHAAEVAVDALPEVLSWLTAEREARQRVERERDEARAALPRKLGRLAEVAIDGQDEARAERDAIAARYDALREAAARVQAKFYEPSEEPDDTLDPMREPLGLLFRALAYPDGAARERAERQAERELRAAVVGYACAVNRHGGIAAESATLANADVMAEIDEMLANSREYDGEPVITERERAIAVAAYASGAFAHCDKGGVTASQIRAAAKERADEIIASVRGRT